MAKRETKNLDDRIDLAVGSIDLLDGPHGRLGEPDTSHCIAEIGEVGSGGYDLFFLNAVNMAWSEKHLSRSESGFQDGFLVVDKIDETAIQSELLKQINGAEFITFEDFVRAFQGKLRWEFA
ncbi:Imm8 family immunity protein [Citromicrobium bathyomarinum]